MWIQKKWLEELRTSFDLVHQQEEAQERYAEILAEYLPEPTQSAVAEAVALTIAWRRNSELAARSQNDGSDDELVVRWLSEVDLDAKDVGLLTEVFPFFDKDPKAAVRAAYRTLQYDFFRWLSAELRALRNATAGKLKEFERKLLLPIPWETWLAEHLVDSLGLETEYLNTRRSSRRQYQEELLGVPPLKPLHSFQMASKELLQQSKKANSVILTLPTGAGKTRIACEYLVERMMKRELNRVLWVANRDELCEQAVQSFKRVWMERWREHPEGEKDELPDRLKVLRVWGGNGSKFKDADLDGGGHTLVVGSIQTLEHSGSTIQETYKALFERAELLVVDECHHAVSDTFTSLLSKWKEKSANGKFLGLTATPFRNSRESTEELFRVLGNPKVVTTVIDGQELREIELHKELTERGLLAEIEDAPPFGIHYVLTEDDLDEFKDLDTGVMKEVADGLYPAYLSESGTSDSRFSPEEIIKGLNPKDDKALVFCPTVDYARRLAFAINRDTETNIRASFIDSETPARQRRRILKSFHEGEIHALCNYGILTTGFDEPRINHLFILRPTRSPVLYSQMLGRGLRGEKNGGTKSCTIYDVKFEAEKFPSGQPVMNLELHRKMMSEKE